MAVAFNAIVVLYCKRIQKKVIMSSTLKQRRQQLRASLTNLKTNGLKVLQQAPPDGVSPTSVLSPVVDPSEYSLGDHMEYLHLHKTTMIASSSPESSQQSPKQSPQPSNHYYSDVSHLMCDSLLPGLVKDYCTPLTQEEWKVHCHGMEANGGMASFGFAKTTTTSSSSASSISSNNFKDLPVRTLTMRLAPDSMTSAVMDAVHDACRDNYTTHQVLKRFQGHFQCLIVPEDESEVPFILDACVSTMKTGVLERQLLLRIYYADSLQKPETKPTNANELEIHSLTSAFNSNGGFFITNSSNSAKKKSSSQQKQRPTTHQQLRAQIMESLQNSFSNSNTTTTNGDRSTIDTSTAMMVPMNLQLRSASAFVQYVVQKQQQQQQHQQLPGMDNPLIWPSPQPSPKASTSHFLANFQPTLSVQDWNGAATPAHYKFPALNSQDWALLQSSWTLISGIWRQCMLHRCLFHTYELASSSIPPVVLDLDYCSHIRQISRDTMMQDLTQSISQLQESLEAMEATYEGFTLVLQKALHGYRMAKHAVSHSKMPTLAHPTSIPPIGYPQLAEMVAKCVNLKDKTKDGKEYPKTAAQVCDETVIKTYKTFGSQDDKESRQYLKDANATIMKRMVQLQEIQRSAIRALELDANTTTASRAFSAQARQATNTLGRVDRVLLARVPLLDMELVGNNGRCQITASNLLCWWDQLLPLGKQKVILVDLRAVKFHVWNANCVSVLDKATSEAICKLHTATDMPRFIALMKCLQQHQDDLVNLLGNLHYPNQFPDDSNTSVSPTEEKTTTASSK